MPGQLPNEAATLERLDTFLDVIRALAWTHTVCSRCDGIGDEPGGRAACSTRDGDGIVPRDAFAEAKSVNALEASKV